MVSVREIPSANQPLVNISTYAWKTLIKEEAMDKDWTGIFGLIEIHVSLPQIKMRYEKDVLTLKYTDTTRVRIIFFDFFSYIIARLYYLSDERSFEFAA